LHNLTTDMANVKIMTADQRINYDNTANKTILQSGEGLCNKNKASWRSWYVMTDFTYIHPCIYICALYKCTLVHTYIILILYQKHVLCGYLCSKSCTMCMDISMKYIFKNITCIRLLAHMNILMYILLTYFRFFLWIKSW